ncbi:phage tail tape measure protein [Brevundimonas terrae]|uniref:Phage tail tape measure protein n=1 Tax=Brevundimonas terrae TaxID=363631 RepID=A0ABN0YGI7_9CAUL|nr:phage tail tape measure protein [Brevundimonas terrae]NIJ26912.1 TP901 family phage tail tape measure protein [Brevundimonas terrae]
MSRNLRLQMILNATGNATKFLKGVRNDTDATSKALRAARERVNDLRKSASNIADYRKLNGKLGETREALTSARTEAARLAKAHAAAGSPTKQLSRALEIARHKVNQLQQAEQSQVRTLQDLRSKLSAAGLSTKNLSGSEAKLARETRSATDAMEAQRKKLEVLNQRKAQMAGARTRYDNIQSFAGTAAGAGASSIGAGMAAAAPLVAASGAAINFQDAMLDVKKVVDFETPLQFRQMNRDVLQLSRDLALPAEGVSQIVAAAGQAKIPRAELKGFAQDAGQMGVAFGTTAEDAGQKMATWRTAFGMNQDAVRGLADEINYLGDNGNATALAISDVVTRVGPLGGVAGLAARETAALGATIVGMGVAEEVAATGIKNTMLALTKGKAATKAQVTAYKALGLEAGAVAKAMQADAGGTIVDVLERVSKLSADEQASTLTQLFGSESVAAIAPMLSQLDVLKTNLDAVADSSKTSGSMAVEFANRMSGTKGAMDQAKEGIKGVAITAGTNFLPVIREVAIQVRDASERFTNFADAHPNVIKVAGTLLAIVAGALLIFGGLALAVAAVLGPFALLQFALAGSSALFAPVIAGLTGMIGTTWAWTAALLANPMTWIVLAIVAAVALLAGGVFLIYKNWGTIGPWFAGVWTKIKEIGSAAIQALIFVFMNFSPVGILIQAFQKVWPALSGLGERFKSIGGDLIKGLINGLMGGLPNVLSTIANLGGKLVTGLKNKLGIRSPSRVFAGLGDETVAGLAQGLNRSSGSAVSAVARVGAGMTAALAVGAGASPSMSFDNGPRIAPPVQSVASQNQTRPSIGQVVINVYAQPGQDEAAIARRIKAMLESPDLSTLGDDPEGFD